MTRARKYARLRRHFDQREKVIEMNKSEELESDEEQSALMHSRAREAGSELRRAIITLSTGSIAILFLALTAEIKPPLSLLEKICAVGTVLSHAAAALSGLFAWGADAERNFFWAHSLSAKQHENWRTKADKERKVRQSVMSNADKTSRILFVVGVLLATIYLLVRTV